MWIYKRDRCYHCGVVLQRGRYTVRCNRAVSLARVDTRYLSLGLMPTSRLYAYAVDKRFYSDRFRNNSLHAQTMASAIFLNREVPYWLHSSITGSAFRGLLLILQKNSMLTDTKIFRSRMGAFRCIVIRYPSRVRNRIRLKWH